MSQSPQLLLYQELLITHARLETHRRLAHYLLTHGLEDAAGIFHVLSSEAKGQASADETTEQFRSLTTEGVNEILNQTMSELARLSDGEEQFAAMYGIPTSDLFTNDAIRSWALLTAKQQIHQWVWNEGWDAEANTPKIPYNGPMP